MSAPLDWPQRHVTLASGLRRSNTRPRRALRIYGRVMGRVGRSDPGELPGNQTCRECSRTAVTRYWAIALETLRDALGSIVGAPGSRSFVVRDICLRSNPQRGG